MQTKEIETKRTLIAWGVGTGVEGQGKEQGLPKIPWDLGMGKIFIIFIQVTVSCVYTSAKTSDCTF